jgi:hypothetical protein
MDNASKYFSIEYMPEVITQNSLSPLEIPTIQTISTEKIHAATRSICEHLQRLCENHGQIFIKTRFVLVRSKISRFFSILDISRLPHPKRFKLQFHWPMESAPSLEPPLASSLEPNAVATIIPSMGFDPTVDLTDDIYGSGKSSEEETDIDDETIKTELEGIEPDSLLGRDPKRVKKDPELIEARSLEYSPLFSYDEFQNLDQLFSFEDASQF